MALPSTITLTPGRHLLFFLGFSGIVKLLLLMLLLELPLGLGEFFFLADVLEAFLGALLLLLVLALLDVLLLLLVLLGELLALSCVLVLVLLAGNRII